MPMAPLNGHGRNTGEMGRRGAVPYGEGRTWRMETGTPDTHNGTHHAPGEKGDTHDDPQWHPCMSTRFLFLEEKLWHF